MRRVTIDTERCIGCGLCEQAMPNLFRVGPYFASVETSTISESLGARLEEVAGECPVGAIRVDAHSLHLAKNDDQEGDREEEHGEIRQYQWEYRNSSQ